MSELRQAIRYEVGQIVPFDETEATHRRDVLEWIDSGADLFRIKKPDTPPKHLVSYFTLIDTDTQKMLLVDHLKAKLWLPTGGHVESGEYPAVAARRECREELNIDADFLPVRQPLFVTVTETVHTATSHTDVSLWYALKGKQDMVLDWDKTEFAGVRWESIVDIAGGDYFPDLRRFCEKLTLMNYQLTSGTL